MNAQNLVLYYSCLRGVSTLELKERKKQPSVPLSPNYIQDRLGPDEEAGFRAAGVLPVAFMGSKKEGEKEESLAPYILLGTEDRSWELSKKKQEERATASLSPLFLNMLGGKRESFDKDAAATGVREFIEESGDILAPRFEELHAAMHDPSSTRVFWHLSGKYALHIYHVPNPVPLWLADLPEQYSKLTETFEMAKLYWFPLKNLLEAFMSSERDLCTYTDDGQPLQILRFMSDMMRQSVLRNYLQGIVSVGGMPPLPEQSIPKEHS